jgi:hypothetical protein
MVPRQAGLQSSPVTAEEVQENRGDDEGPFVKRLWGWLTINITEHKTLTAAIVVFVLLGILWFGVALSITRVRLGPGEEQTTEDITTRIRETKKFEDMQGISKKAQDSAQKPLAPATQEAGKPSAPTP